MVRIFFQNPILFFIFCLLAGNQVFAAPGDNVALATAGGVASQSSFFNTNWPASNCINGITITNSNAQLCHSKRFSDPNEWWDVELPSSVPIDSIVIHNRINCCTTRILDLYVLVSSTPFPPGSDAASLAAARAQATFEFLITNDVQVTSIPVGDLPGKFVRIQKSGVGINANQAYNLLEVEVFEGEEEVELSIVKTVNDTTPSIGDIVTFTLTIANAGNTDATNVSVNDIVPAGLTNITNISNGGVLTAGNQIDWTIATLAFGNSVQLTFQAEVLPP